MGGKTFYGGKNFLGQILGGREVVLLGSSDQIMRRGRKSFTNALSGNLNSVNLKIFPGYGGRHT